MVGLDIGAAFIPNIKQAASPLSADANVIQLISSTGVVMGPRVFVAVSVFKQLAADHELVIQTKLSEQLAVFSDGAHATGSHDVLTVLVISSDGRVVVSHDYDDVLPFYCCNRRLKFVVESLFYSEVGAIGGSVRLNDGDIAYVALKSGGDNPRRARSCLAEEETNSIFVRLVVGLARIQKFSSC